MQFSVTIVMYIKRCIQYNIFMFIADHVHITIFGGLGCFWYTKFHTERCCISMIFSFILEKRLIEQ